MSYDQLILTFGLLMGIAILLYVILDGYDLGVGMLMPVADAQEQEIMVASIGPFWDANETWLVLGIGILLVAFPKAHGIVLTALYLPVTAMLIGLMLRGVAFEFRIKAEGWHRELWNWLFSFGSLMASLAQGLMLGRYISSFEAGVIYWMFGLLVGVSLCGGYILLGATWLVMRTEGVLQRKAMIWARWGLLWVLIGIALVSIATTMLSHTVSLKWFSFPETLPLLIFPIAILYAGWHVLMATGRLLGGERRTRSRGKTRDWMPFASAAFIFLLAFSGLAYSVFPYIIIDQLTIWESAAHISALEIVLVGVVIVLPFLFAYTIFAYRVFRGKVSKGLYE